MRSLKPPAETTADGVTYRPVPMRRLGGIWVLMACVSALAAAGNGFEVPMTTALFALSTLFWGLAAIADTRRGAVFVGMHRVIVEERLLGLRRKRIEVAWEDLRGARVDGDRLTLLRADGGADRTSVRGTPGQIAWIAGHVSERAAQAELEPEQAQQLEEDRLKLLELMRQGATVTETP